MRPATLAICFITLLFTASVAPAVRAQTKGEVVNVSSLAELQQVAALNEQTVVMKPGVYKLTDYVPLATIAERRKRKEWPFLTFSGSSNTFKFEGVTLEIDTALRAALHPPVHTSEIIFSGAGNSFSGLTIQHIGAGTSPGGAALSIEGRGNSVSHFTLHVRGSFPYGYGDMFGKGGPGIIPHQKKSGVHITGSGTRLTATRIYMHAFGHGCYIQEDAADVTIDDCTVEGEMRSTSDILAETAGPAFDVGFRTVIKNRSGEARVLPGYVKALSEDGFRTYGTHKNLVIKNCTVKNMRGGFEVRTPTGPRLENCQAQGCERGFWVSTNARLSKCQSDAQYGPALYVEGENARVEIELIAGKGTLQGAVHTLAAISGKGHHISLTGDDQAGKGTATPVLIGYSAPGMGENMVSNSEREAKEVVFHNETSHPVNIGARASLIQLTTRGPVIENRGKAVTVASP